MTTAEMIEDVLRDDTYHERDWTPILAAKLKEAAGMLASLCDSDVDLKRDEEVNDELHAWLRENGFEVKE